MGLCVDRERRILPGDEVSIKINGQTTCEICTLSFDLTKKLPMVLCLNQHCICKTCLEDLKDHKCPSCRK